MDDLISRREAADIVRFECGEWQGLAKTIIKKLEALPSAQPEADKVARDIATIIENEKDMRVIASAEPKKGNWSYCEKYDDWKCSLCGQHALGRYNYCPDCGARMEGESDEIN